MSRGASIALLWVAALLPVSALAEPPPDDIDKVTAPAPMGGRHGPPPPRPGADRPVPSRDTATALGLQRQPDGSYVYVDPGRRFTMRVDQDGRARFADRWRRADPEDSQHGRCCGRPPEGVAPAFNPFWAAPFSGPIEWMMRAADSDPAGAAKADVLLRTREFRTRLAIAAYRELVDRRLAELPAELEAIWTDRDRSVAVRKALLFARWDDCEDRLHVAGELPDEAIGSIDRLRLRAADHARNLIESFVREHAPPGSGLAFTAAELEALNRDRRSAPRFDPYSSTSPTAAGHS